MHKRILLLLNFQWLLCCNCISQINETIKISCSLNETEIRYIYQEALRSILYSELDEINALNLKTLKRNLREAGMLDNAYVFYITSSADNKILEKFNLISQQDIRNIKLTNDIIQKMSFNVNVDIHHNDILDTIAQIKKDSALIVKLVFSDIIQIDSITNFIGMKVIFDAFNINKSSFLTEQYYYIEIKKCLDNTLFLNQLFQLLPSYDSSHRDNFMILNLNTNEYKCE